MQLSLIQFTDGNTLHLSPSQYIHNCSMKGEPLLCIEVLWTRKQIQLDDGTWKLISVPKTERILESQELLDQDMSTLSNLSED